MVQITNITRLQHTARIERGAKGVEEATVTLKFRRDTALSFGFIPAHAICLNVQFRLFENGGLPDRENTGTCSMQYTVHSTHVSPPTHKSKVRVQVNYCTVQ